MADYSSLTVHLGLVIIVVLAMNLLAGKLAPSNPSAAKLKPYECGVSEPGSIQVRWPVRFALLAMLFLIFDVEALFFFPWAVIARELGVRGLFAMSSFFIVLGAGYVYVRSRGALTWR
jgi:NADH-quinone oxidoreductase subunit A